MDSAGAAAPRNTPVSSQVAIDEPRGLRVIPTTFPSPGPPGQRLAAGLQGACHVCRERCAPHGDRALRKAEARHPPLGPRGKTSTVGDRPADLLAGLRAVLAGFCCAGIVPAAASLRTAALRDRAHAPGSDAACHASTPARGVVSQ